MRAFRFITFLSLTLCTTIVFADDLYRVEMLIFRQSDTSIPAKNPAPDQWAGHARTANDTQQVTALDAEAGKLIEGNGYQLLFHQAWNQTFGRTPDSVAISAGEEYFGHYPLEGTVTFSRPDQFADIGLTLWVNQFSSDGFISGSEQLKQRSRLKPNTLTYLDHDSLGVLVRLTPLRTSTAFSDTEQASPAETFTEEDDCTASDLLSGTESVDQSCAP